MTMATPARDRRGAVTLHATDGHGAVEEDDLPPYARGAQGGEALEAHRLHDVGRDALGGRGVAASERGDQDPLRRGPNDLRLLLASYPVGDHDPLRPDL